METWLRLAAVALAAYVGVCLLLYLLQDWMIFFPRSLANEPTGAHVERTSLQRGDVTLRGWVVNRHSEGPLLFYFGGNAEEVSGLVDVFARLDAVTVLMNYRGYGTSEGKPSAARLIEDAAAVVGGLRHRFGADRPVVLFGRSLGSGIATLAARDESIDGLILLSPYRSIERIAKRRFPFAPVGWLLRHNIDATLAINALPERILVLYATSDSVVPTDESRAFLRELKSDPQVVTFDGPHNVPLEVPQLWRAIEGFLRQI
ncbi:MAG: alpha/beta fold hydrolase [Gammaproteobacteria bacterium]|nr:alpha/beta fold hydrolase [Gammaproteobacteria bacterium]MDE0273269.1 alpha/beta fold hydrolase [Gammaproteobacteria bacterium]